MKNPSNERSNEQGTSESNVETGQEKTNAGAEAMTGAAQPPEGDELTTPGRDRQHVSGYGGGGGDPKATSDTREPNRPD
jgi:hypothetical protein